MHKLVLGFAVLLLSACTNTARVAENQAIPPVPKDQAQIIFMRSTTVNMLVGTNLYNVTTGTPKLIGNIPNGSKVITNLPPGNHVFMVGNSVYRDFMKASVEAGRRYYVVVTAYWPANFSLRPFRRANSEFLYASAKFNDLTGDTKIVLDDPESVKQEEAEREKTMAFYSQGWERWQAKTNEQKEILTLNREDFAD
ncbi:MAG: hypothetical protein ACREUW_06165 [Burkholderiales bacterium]